MNLLWNESGIYALKEIKIPAAILDQDFVDIDLFQSSSSVGSNSSNSLEYSTTRDTQQWLDPLKASAKYD